MENEKSSFEKIGAFIKNSVTLKLLTITVLMLLLLIPASMIQSIIEERQYLSEQSTNAVSAKWAHAQQINGPVLTIPLLYEFEEGDEIRQTERLWNILPEHLKIDGVLNPKTLQKGIYEVVVYESELALSGNFKIGEVPDPKHLKEISYDRAFLTIGVTDLRGIQQQIEIDWAGKALGVEPGTKLKDLIYSGVTATLPEILPEEKDDLPFGFKMDLQGSKSMSFVPLGSTTEVHLSSGWSGPSFHGNFLPDTRKVEATGFNAKWNILQLNRNFAQSWTGEAPKSQMQSAAFGVDLLLPMDDYQKSSRSAKYAGMIIALTFLIFFLVEVINKRRIHPFQYALVGLALCLFYTLLVSISEHTNFNVAYAISTAGIVVMISLYSLSVFKKLKRSLLLCTSLLALYGFLFVTLQLSDYALLMGSVGMAVILAFTMYFTRDVNWYQDENLEE